MSGGNNRRWRDKSNSNEASLPKIGNSRQIRDRVSNIIVRHGQNWNLSDRSITSLHTTSTLVNGRQISVPLGWERRDRFSQKFWNISRKHSVFKPFLARDLELRLTCIPGNHDDLVLLL